MVSCVHHIPGRARFKIEALRRDAELAKMIEGEVCTLRGVVAVEINRHAASIVVHYCVRTGEIDKIMDNICAHCPRAALNRRANQANQPVATQTSNDGGARMQPKVMHAMSEAVSKAVLNTFINRTIERGLSSIMTGRR